MTPDQAHKLLQHLAAAQTALHHVKVSVIASGDASDYREDLKAATSALQSLKRRLRAVESGPADRSPEVDNGQK